MTRSSRDEVPVAGSGERTRAGTAWAALLCWLTVALEGFDLVALGAVIPTLLETQYLGITAGDATLIATVSLIGVGIGAAVGGHMTDRHGRRQALFGSVLVFSVFTILVPLAPSLAWMGAARFAAGLGLGACMPTAITIMSELAPATRRASATTVTMTGYHVGAVAMALLAIVVVPHWQILFYVGGAFGLVLLPVVWVGIADTSASRGPARHAGPDSAPLLSNAAGAPSVVLRRPYRFATILSWITSFMGLLLVYGLNTWLPQIMRSAGYSLASSLSLLLIMNAGAIVGLVLAGVVGDLRGIKAAARSWFVASALFLGLLSVRMDSELLLHVVVFVTGLFVFSAQGLVYALLAHLFPRHLRGTAIGFASGVGRLGAVVGPAVTGVLVGRGLGHPWGFYVFATVAVLAVVALTPMPSRPIRRSELPVA